LTRRLSWHRSRDIIARDRGPRPSIHLCDEIYRIAAIDRAEHCDGHKHDTNIYCTVCCLYWPGAPDICRRCRRVTVIIWSHKHTHCCTGRVTFSLSCDKSPSLNKASSYCTNRSIKLFVGAPLHAGALARTLCSRGVLVTVPSSAKPQFH